MANNNGFFNSQSERDYTRRNRLAELLINAGANQPTEVIGGMAIAQPKFSGLIRGLMSGVGQYQNRQSDDIAMKDRDARQQNIAAALAKVQAGDLNAGYSQLGIDPSYTGAAFEGIAGLEKEKIKQKALMQAIMARSSATSSKPATLAIADEIIKNLEASGRTVTPTMRANIIRQAGKTDDKGLDFYSEPDDLKSAINNHLSPAGVDSIINLGAGPQPTSGYADAVGINKKQINRLGAQGTKVGEDEGEKIAQYNNLTAGAPQLEATLSKLSTLGQTATYTKAGLAKNEFLRQTDQPVPQGANDREAYINTVKTELFPLLKQTLGSQFTEGDREELLTTLGDPNKSPTEKDAAIKAFTAEKIGTRATLGRQLGMDTAPLINPIIQSDLPNRSALEAEMKRRGLRP